MHLRFLINSPSISSLEPYISMLGGSHSSHCPILILGPLPSRGTLSVSISNSCSQFPIPNSQFLIPNSQFPVPNSYFLFPNSPSSSQGSAQPSFTRDSSRPGSFTPPPAHSLPTPNLLSAIRSIANCASRRHHYCSANAMNPEQTFHSPLFTLPLFSLFSPYQLSCSLPYPCPTTPALPPVSFKVRTYLCTISITPLLIKHINI